MARSFVSATENDVLNWLVGAGGYTPSPSNLVLRLSTTFPSDGGSITEPSGGGYVEQPIAFGAASSGVASNSSAITFPVATVGWGTIVGWAVRDTVAAKTLFTGYMGTHHDYVWSVDASTNNLVDVVQNAPANDLPVFFSRYDPDGFPIGGASLDFDAREDGGAVYWVVNSGVAGADQFQISLTKGGSAVDLTGPTFGALAIWLSKIRAVNAGDQLEFPIGSISISLK